MSPGVTLVIPCFNHGRFIAECVRGLENQSFREWRAIVLDDCSTDGETPALCDAVKSERVTVVHLPENQGRGPVRNVGITMATTEAVMSLDADDILEPEHLEKTVPTLLEHDRCGVVYTDYRLFGTESRIMRGRPFDRALLYKQQYIFAGSLFRKSAFEKTAGYRREFNIGNEDWDFWLSILEAGYDARYVPEPLYRYRRHTDAWSAQDPGARVDNLVRSRELLRDLHRDGFEQSGQLRAFEFDTYFEDGRARLKLGRAPEARQSLRLALRARPASARAWLLLLRTYLL